MSNKIYTVKFPLEIGVNDVGFNSVTDLKETVEYNLKSTLLTNPGEIVSDPNFGVGLMRVIFEMPTGDLISTLRSRINFQIKTYIPYIQVLQTKINASPDSKELNIAINYRISTSQTRETFNFSVSLTDI